MPSFEDQIFSGGTGITPEQQAAMAAALRNRDEMGMIMAMTGDRALAPAGKLMVQNSSAQRQQAINMEYYRNQMAAAKERQAETSRHNREMEAIGHETSALRSALLGQAQADKASKAWEKQIQDFGKSLEKSGITKVGAAFDDMVNAIEPYVREGKNVPGLGGINNNELVGGLWNAASREGAGVRGAVDRFVGYIAFGEGGKALTQQEKAVIIGSLRRGTFNSEEDFLAGLKEAKHQLDQALRRNIATYGGPEVMKEYISRGGVLPSLGLGAIGEQYGDVKGTVVDDPATAQAPLYTIEHD